MKKRVFKTILSLLLTASFLLAVTGCTPESPPLDPPTEAPVFSPKKVVAKVSAAS